MNSWCDYCAGPCQGGQRYCSPEHRKAATLVTAWLRRLYPPALPLKPQGGYLNPLGPKGSHSLDPFGREPVRS